MNEFLLLFLKKRFNSAAHETRWKQIEIEVKLSGGYQLNDLELIFGAKTAWRNSARCIGRIQWSKLQVGSVGSCRWRWDWEDWKFSHQFIRDEKFPAADCRLRWTKYQQIDSTSQSFESVVNSGKISFDSTCNFNSSLPVSIADGKEELCRWKKA